ncbi:YbaB/EbfC family nucleoid-associated protein [Umezawaea tangerina]|nr:YbaB/EbfC family nucleoid-associated protein [Umezawaea tangerina]
MTSQERPVMPGDLRKLADDLQRKAELYGRLQAQLNRTSVTETSPDGGVRVAVDATGVPTAFTFTERFRSMDTATMSAALLATLRRAHVRLRDEVVDLTTATVGDDGPGNDLVAKYRERFPDPPAEDDAVVEVMRFESEETAPGPSRTQHPPNPDDTDFGGSVYR